MRYSLQIFSKIAWRCGYRIWQDIDDRILPGARIDNWDISWNTQGFKYSRSWQDIDDRIFRRAIIDNWKGRLKKNIVIGILAIVGVIGVAISFGNAGDAPAGDPFNATFIIEGTRICLLNGRFEKEAAPGSAMKIKTCVFGKPAYGDIDGDGYEDAAMVIVHDPGGSGRFFYVVAALKVNGAYHGTNGVLLGDRISPQDIKIRNSVVVANYADRRPEESMAITPSIGKSKYLTITNGILSEIEPVCNGSR